MKRRQQQGYSGRGRAIPPEMWRYSRCAYTLTKLAIYCIGPRGSKVASILHGTMVLQAAVKKMMAAWRKRVIRALPLLLMRTDV